MFFQENKNGIAKLYHQGLEGHVPGETAGIPANNFPKIKGGSI